MKQVVRVTLSRSWAYSAVWKTQLLTPKHLQWRPCSQKNMTANHALAAAFMVPATHSLAQADYYFNPKNTPDSSLLTSPFIIGVAGGTASGKTLVCKRIIEQLQAFDVEHQGILSLSQDCFYRNLTADEQKDISNFNFDHPSAFAFDEVVHCLKQLKAGKPVDIPVYDFVTSSRLDETTQVAHADVILFDGILAFYTEELRDLFDMKIFVDSDADTRLARRMRRDIVERGRDVLQVLDQYERTVKPSFESYILPTKQHADIIVPRGGENHVAIDLILQHIRLKLLMRTRPGAAVRRATS